MLHQKYPDIWEPEYLVLGRFHIRKFTTIFTLCAIFSMLFGLIFERKELLQISSALALLFVQCLVVFADKAEKPWAYLPFLIVNGIFTIFGSVIVGLAIILIILVVVLAAIGKVRFSDKFEANDYRPGYAPKFETFGEAMWQVVILCAILLLLILYTFYHWTLVYRARRYMIKEIVSGNTRKAMEDHLNPIAMKV